MSHVVTHRRQRRLWQFSLKGLMFLTFIVAICAALVYLSVGLAILMIPLIASAALRTLRAIPEVSCDRPSAGLTATFCQSILLLVTLIFVSAMTVCVGGLAAALIVLTFVARGGTAILTLLPAWLSAIWRKLRATWKSATVVAMRMAVARFIQRLRAFAVASTVLLSAATRRVFRTCLYPELARSR